MLWLFNALATWLGIKRAASKTAKPNFINGFQVNGSDYTATELNTALGSGDPGTAGTVTASKPVIVDANKDIATFRNLTGTTLTGTGVTAGASGTAGTITVYPTTASKGSLTITQSDNSGNTVNAINVAAQAAARNISIPDASTKASTDSLEIALIKRASGAPSSQAGAIGCLYVDSSNGKLSICPTASATSATWTVVGTQT